MKKVILIFAGLVVLVTVYNFVDAKASIYDQQQAAGDYVLIRYNPSSSVGGSYVVINYGDSKIEKLEVPKEISKLGSSNYVVDLLNQFNGKGYTLVSTSSHSLGQVSEITCFLKQSR